MATVEELLQRHGNGRYPIWEPFDYKNRYFQFRLAENWLVKKATAAPTVFFVPKEYHPELEAIQASLRIQQRCQQIALKILIGSLVVYALLRSLVL